MRRTLSSSVCLSSSFALLAAAVLVPATAHGQQNSAPADERATVVACVVRQQDYVRTPSAPDRSDPSHLLLIDAGSGRPRYNLTGLREAEMAVHVGQRVEVSGSVEQPRRTPVVTTVDATRPGSVNRDTPGAVGVTPDGAAAHEPTDAVAASVPTGRVAEPARVSDPDYVVETLPALNVTSYRRVDGACDMPARAEAAAPAGQTVAQAAPPPAGARPQVQAAAAPRPMTVRGCLARQTAGGTALSVQAGTDDALILTKALFADGADGTTGRAAAAPSGERNSGTVPEAVGTAGASADASTLSFALTTQSGQREPLLKHVGEIVEVTGLVGEEAPSGAAVEAGGPVIAGRAEAAKTDPAHPSAPLHSIAVTAFRAVGGSCN